MQLNVKTWWWAVWAMDSRTCKPGRAHHRMGPPPLFGYRSIKISTQKNPRWKPWAVRYGFLWCFHINGVCCLRGAPSYKQQPQLGTSHNAGSVCTPCPHSSTAANIMPLGVRGMHSHHVLQSPPTQTFHHNMILHWSVVPGAADVVHVSVHALEMWPHDAAAAWISVWPWLHQ